MLSASGGTAKAAKPNDPTNPLAPIQQLLDAVHVALTEQPEALRRPFAVAGLRVVSKEIEKCIATMEDTKHHEVVSFAGGNA